MSENRAKMSVTQLTLLTAINMMGSGIVMLPTKLAEVGTISILSWLITALGSLCLAYAFAKCGMFSNVQVWAAIQNTHSVRPVTSWQTTLTVYLCCLLISLLLLHVSVMALNSWKWN